MRHVRAFAISGRENTHLMEHLLLKRLTRVRFPVESNQRLKDYKY